MIKVYVLTPQGVREESDIVKARQAAKEGSGFIWIDIRSCTKDDIQTVAEALNLHTVAVESVLNPYSRPHLVEYEDHFHVNFTSIKVNRNHKLKPDEFHVFVSRDYVVTAGRNGGGELVDQILSYYRDTPALVERGSFYALYLIADRLVDSYFPVVESLDDEIDSLEDDMLKDASEENLHKLLQLKRKLFDLRRFLGPQRDIFNELARRDFPFLQENFQIYFQDIYNRMIRVFDVMDTSREVVTGAMDLYQSAVSNRLNDIMKILTVFATILGMLTLITGFFGMNFTHLPWLEARDAFSGMLMFMGAVIIVMYLYFRRKKWW